MTAIYLNTEGEPINAPKNRTMAAIRREAATRANKRPNYGRAGYATRAWAYAHAMQGIEVPCVGVNYRIEKYCRWSKAPDGSNRIRAVDTDAGLYEIPNWDFTPAEPVEIVERPAYVSQDIFA
jgi:hypothetical protein